MEHIPNVLSLSFLIKSAADLPVQYENYFAVFDNNKISLFSLVLLPLLGTWKVEVGNINLHNFISTDF